MPRWEFRCAPLPRPTFHALQHLAERHAATQREILCVALDRLTAEADANPDSVRDRLAAFRGGR